LANHSQFNSLFTPNLIDFLIYVGMIILISLLSHSKILKHKIMDFIDRIKAFAAGIPPKLDGVKTEAATQQFLVIPFIQQILGYDTSDPNEVMPEYDANVGASKKFKGSSVKSMPNS
jgi:hypothetical protein